MTRKPKDLQRSIGLVKTMARERFYLLRVGGEYVRHFRHGELVEKGERFHIHASFPDAARFATLVEATEDLVALLTQLRTVPGYADCSGVVAAIEMHETCVITSELV